MNVAYTDKTRFVFQVFEFLKFEIRKVRRCFMAWGDRRKQSD